MQQSPARAAHKGGHACESIELHQYGVLVGGLGLARRSFELRGGSAAQGRGRRAASAEAIDVHGVCLYNNRQIGRRIKEGMHANLLSCINMELWMEAWAWRAGAWSCAAAAPRRDAGAGLTELRPSPRGAEGLETWALPAWRAPGLACKSGCKRTHNAKASVTIVACIWLGIPMHTVFGPRRPPQDGPSGLGQDGD